MSMTLVSTVTVGSGGAATISFNSLPQTGTDLLLVMSLRDTVGDGAQNNINFNGDTASNYSYRILQGYPPGTNSYNSAATSSINPLYTNFSGSTSLTFANSQVYIPNYTSSSAKSVSSDVVTENNASAAYAQIGAHRWTGTAAITSIVISANNTGSLVQHSSASLYLITKGSGGATVS